MKQIIALIAVVAVMISVFPAGIVSHAAGFTTKMLDLGGKVTASGYTGVSASDKYDSRKGYGFNDTNFTQNVEASGRGALSDAVHIKGGNGHFKVDLPTGVYKITVTTGNVKPATIVAEEISGNPDS
ncbi:MAG: hypothetical protein IKN14_01470 [Clostridiales bacterium]|nr:hypothetical protein [Clostridiales bacterium]